MIKTRMTELLGIEYPIIMGPMAWITTSGIVAAVSNAGGAGVIAAGGRGGAWLHEEIAKTRALTDKPFGVNIPLSYEGSDELLDACVAEKVPFVTLGAGDPRPLIQPLKNAGITVICIVPSTKLAKRIEAAGADMLIIEGMESGGRIGNLTTMALMSNVLPEVTDIPVAAAGGIVDGRGIAAALTMGADGVQMGSRFLLASECESHPSNAQAIINAVDTDVCTIGWSRGKGLRGLKNEFAVDYLAKEVAGVPTAELSEMVKSISKEVADNGTGPDGMGGIVQVGESVGPLKKIQPAAEIVQELMSETEAALKRGATLIS